MPCTRYEALRCSQAHPRSAWCPGRARRGRSGPRGGQAATGLGGAEQNVGQPVTGLLPGKPAQQHRPDLVTPGQQDRTARVDNDDGARVGRRHRGHQLVLAPRKVQCGPIEPLALDLVGGTHDHDGDVGGSRQFHGRVELVAFRQPRRVGGESHGQTGPRCYAPSRAQLDGDALGRGSPEPGEMTAPHGHRWGRRTPARCALRGSAFRRRERRHRRCPRCRSAIRRPPRVSAARRLPPTRSRRAAVRRRAQVSGR